MRSQSDPEPVARPLRAYLACAHHATSLQSRTFNDNWTKTERHRWTETDRRISSLFAILTESLRLHVAAVDNRHARPKRLTRHISTGLTTMDSAARRRILLSPKVRNKCVSKTHIRHTGLQLKLCATLRLLFKGNISVA